MGKPKYKKFFPEKVYRCNCLAGVIACCLSNEIYSLVDICFKVNKTIRKKIYCAKCGKDRQNVIFSCTDHMPMVIFAVQTSQSTENVEQALDIYSELSLSDETKNYCPICVKKYLQEMFFLFGHVNLKKKINFLFNFDFLLCNC